METVDGANGCALAAGEGRSDIAHVLVCDACDKTRFILEVTTRTASPLHPAPLHPPTPTHTHTQGELHGVDVESDAFRFTCKGTPRLRAFGACAAPDDELVACAGRGAAAVLQGVPSTHTRAHTQSVHDAHTMCIRARHFI